MANSWAQSRELTRKAWSVLGDNRRLLSFPIIAGLINLGLLIVLGVGALVLFVIQSGVTLVLGIVLVIVLIYLTQLVTILARAAMVSCADEALAGRPLAIGAGWRVAFQHFGDVAQWAGVSTLASILIGAIRGNGQGNLAAVILRNTVAAAAGVAWSIITLFVLPFIVLGDHGVIDSIKGSANVVKERWGTQLSGGVRIGARLLFIVLPAIALIIVGFLVVQVSAVLCGVLIVLGFLLMAVAGLLGGTVRTIFSVALYRFAVNGEVVGGFTEQELQSAVRTRG